jgi:ABC-type lipoprotein export system ATPase subunit
MPDIIISATDLHRSFQIGKRRIEVLRGINLDVIRGEVAFLIGASGAGKTTLLYTLGGLEKPEAGIVRFDGQSIYDMGDDSRGRHRNRSMGFIFQGYFLLPELTALENVILPAGITERKSGKRAAELLASVGLGDRLHHLPAELSGGEQQRVAIARSLINDPDVIFADEPTGNLDSANGAAIMDLLVNLAKDAGKTLLVVTHDPTHSDRGDRKIEIRDGVIVRTADQPA